MSPQDVEVFEPQRCRDAEGFEVEEGLCLPALVRTAYGSRRLQLAIQVAKVKPSATADSSDLYGNPAK